MARLVGRGKRQRCYSDAKKKFVKMSACGKGKAKAKRSKKSRRR